MKEAVGKIFPANQALSGATIHSNPISVVYDYGYALQLSWVGNATGSFTIEVSNDVGSVNPITGVISGVTTWSTLANSSTDAGGTDGNFMYIVTDVYYRYIRVTFVGTGGSSVLNGNFSLKAV